MVIPDLKMYMAAAFHAFCACVGDYISFSHILPLICLKGRTVCIYCDKTVTVPEFYIPTVAG